MTTGSGQLYFLGTQESELIRGCCCFSVLQIDHHGGILNIDQRHIPCGDLRSIEGENNKLFFIILESRELWCVDSRKNTDIRISRTMACRSPKTHRYQSFGNYGASIAENAPILEFRELLRGESRHDTPGSGLSLYSCRKQLRYNHRLDF